MQAQDNESGKARHGGILLVEEHPFIRSQLRELLREEGFEVVAVDGPETALAVLRRRPIQLLITASWFAGDIQGVELLLRARTPRLLGGAPAILMASGAAREIPSGVVVLRMPFAISELLRSARELLLAPARDEGPQDDAAAPSAARLSSEG